MQIGIHKVKKIDIGDIEKFEENKEHKEFFVRRIKIYNKDNDECVEIVLFSDKKEELSCKGETK